MVEFEQTLAQLRVLAESLRTQSVSRPATDAPAGEPPVVPAAGADVGHATGPAAAGSHVLDPACDREIVLLLAAGATDETIARRLGISARTVQRRVHALMEHLGVRTRFQAGVQAALRHWC